MEDYVAWRREIDARVDTTITYLAKKEREYLGMTFLSPVMKRDCLHAIQLHIRHLAGLQYLRTMVKTHTNHVEKLLMRGGLFSVETVAP